MLVNLKLFSKPLMFGLVFGFLAVNAEAQRNYKIQFTKCSCISNSSHIKALECSLRNDSDHQSLIDGRLEFALPIPELDVRTILVMTRKNMPRMTIFDITVKACDFLDIIHKHKILSLFAKTFKQYLNVLPKCPLRKNFNYTLTGMHFNVEDFPTYLPEGEFQTTHHVMVQQQVAIKLVFWGRVIYGKSGNNQRRKN